MITVTCYSGKTVAVFGLGISGIKAAKALEAGGAKVVCWDDGDNGRWNANEAGLTVENLREAFWPAFDALVLSPGVPLTHPDPHWTVKKAEAAGVEVIGDTELFFREKKALGSKARVIGITGTNGKSTTTALVAHLLQSAGVDVQMGGNIGTAVLALAPFSDERVYVIEYSSYQIDLTPSLHLDGAVLLNITPDHIDRHGTLENYARVKSRIFQNMHAGQTAVIGVDDELSSDIADGLNGGMNVIRLSVENELSDGIYAKDGVLYQASGDAVASLADLNGIGSLRGAHNWQNAGAAIALVRSVGVSDEDIVEGLKTFPGLEHRMQEVGRDGSVLYVNDSKATNADAAEKALAAFDNIYWIVGGVAKDGGIEPLRCYFPKVAKAYLIGESAEAFSKMLGDTPFEISETIDQAVLSAARDAQASEVDEKVVLLAPACASFDQFPNFVLRGKAFCEAVAKVLK